MLSEKLTLLNALDKQILAVSKVQEVEKEIDETETFKTCIIDTTADILTRTTPPVMKLVPSKITKDGLKKIIFADNASFQQTRQFNVACRKEINAPVCMLPDNHTDKIQAIDVGKWTQ